MTLLARALVIASLFLAMTGRADAGNAALGLAVGLAVAASLRRVEPDTLMTRPLVLLRFAFGAVREVSRGVAAMLRVTLGLAPWRHVGFVDLPLEERSERGAVVSAFVLTASPGEIAVELPREDCLRVSTIDARDPRRLERHFERFYHRYQRPLVR